MSKNRRRASGTRTLGTFGGVFTPSILTILGIILFLRLGWVVGQAGLAHALLIIGLAHAVSILTSLSLAAIATNRKVRAGGDYHLISRSLGLEYGGALGVVLFAAQSISVAFYCFGFGELAAPLVSQAGYPVSLRELAAAAAALLGVLAFLGADLATRFQYGVMLAIVLALAAFFAGSATAFEPARLAQAWQPPDQGLPFWAVFAVFFPAVTGFTQGVSLSGDLRDPARSLPVGTLTAVAVSLVVYTSAAIAFAGAAPLGILQEDRTAFGRVSLFETLFRVGVVAATLSSALASFLGAPRILQAMARDEIFRVLNPFAKTDEATGNPRRAVAFTAVIAFAVLALGELDGVARLISMFFLISYALLNAATYVEARGASPAFRPRFRFFHARLSLLGALTCLGAMLAIDFGAATIAIAVLACVHQYLRRTSVPVSFVDSRRAYEFRKLKETVQEIDRHPESEWTWQPNILTLAGDAEHNDLVLRLATSLSGDSGIVTAVGLIEGEGDFESTLELRERTEDALREELRELRLDAFPLVVAAPDFRDAVVTLLQTWGIGPVRANTVLVNWYQRLPEGDERGRDPLWYGRELRGILRLGCHVLAVDLGGKEWRRVSELPPEERRIDVWWSESPSGRLSLLLAYLATRSPDWEDSPLRLLVPCEEGREERVGSAIGDLLEEARIDAEVEIVGEVGAETVVFHSARSAIVFMPLRIAGMRVVDPFVEDGEIEKLLPELPVVVLVGASGGVSLRDPDDA